MARKEVTQYFDDLTDKLIENSDDVVTIEFTVNGEHYRLDTVKAGADKFHKAVQPFVSKATNVPKRRTRGTANTSRAQRERNRAIRAWALGRGMDVSDRGKLPADVVSAYEDYMRTGGVEPST